MLSEYPTEMLGIASASVSGWMLYEYLNFYVNLNWYYPFSHQLTGDKNNDQVFLLYSIIGSSGLLPMAFEWYDLMLTVPWLSNRFDAGVKYTMPTGRKIVLLIVALAGISCLGLFSLQIFYLWLWPLIIISIVLSFLKVWTPFTPIKAGNWTPLLIFALAYLVQGFVMEGWNYFSAVHENGEAVRTYTPAYWAYKFPYVDGYEIFEMPVLGFLGYLPFSLYCWIWWIMYAVLLGIRTRYFDHTETYRHA